MVDGTLITGTTVGDISYVVAYYDVNTGNLYDANGNMYGNSTLTTTLDNEFILELHYVQNISTDSDPTTWAVWDGLEGKTVDSSLAFDSDYKHAYEGASTESTAAASHEIKVTVSSVDKDTLNSEGNLIINPYGLEPEQIPQGSTSTPRMVVPYDSFEYVSSNTSGTVFKFHVADPDGLMYAVPANIQVRVSDPLYLYINPSSIYEVNIPPRYNEGVFKFPMNIMSRKLLKALDYTGVSGVVGTLEHKISVRRDTLTGVSYNSNTYTRDKDKDSTAVYSGDTFLFCAWVNGSSTIWTKGNDVQTNTAVYSISNGTATLLGSTANPVTETDSVLFRTFAFPFLVKNLIDYNATIDIPMQDVDWAKDYIISIIKNNMEEVTGKASTGAYGVVKIANDGTIDVDDGVISIATSLATKQDNMSATAPVAINNSTVSLNFGDGLAVGVTGTANANKLIVNEASVKEVLEDVVDGGTEPAVNEIVTADNLRGALSVGQAVDVSCPFNRMELTTDMTTENFLSTFTLTGTGVSDKHFGFNPFQKFVSGLKYLLRFDITNNDNTSWSLGIQRFSENILNINPVAAGETKRFAAIFNNSQPDFFTQSSSASMHATISKFRVYEVTALTDEAIAYIAQLEDPDAFFRSTSAYSIRDKYLIKQDMVCPFIPTINMPDNSDLTVVAGLSYKIKYTNDNTHIITADTIPSDAYGWDTHIQMFIKGTSAINFQAPLVLMDALTPNAGHNLVVKWRNGDALVYVDDTNAGNIVISTSGTTAGTLNYFLQQDPGSGQDNYIIFAATTDNVPCDAGTVTVNYNTDILGNGTDKTTITGGISVASGKTINFQSLAIAGGTLSGAGRMNFDDVSIASGSTVSCAVRTFINDLDINGTFAHTYTMYNLSTATRASKIKSTIGSGTLITAGPMYLQNNPVISGVEVTGSITLALFCVADTVPFGNTVTVSDCYVHDVQGTLNGIWLNATASNPLDVYISGCTIANNKFSYTSTADNCGGFFRGLGVRVNVTDTVLENNSLQLYDKAFLICSGTITLKGSSALIRSNGSGFEFNNCLLDLTSSTLVSIDKNTGLFLQNYSVTGSLTIKTNTGVTEMIDACTFDKIWTDGRLVAYNRNITITASGMNPWKATNIIFASPLDATEANTIKLTGTTFTTTAKTLNASRIQLPASTTVSFQGNTNDANTKILDAGLIVVGDNPASPSGSATVVNASGTSSTVTGIGTYIDKEGDNDFVSNNTTNVKAVDASTTGAKYLGTVLSATTGETGANRFAKIDSGAVAVVNEATNAVNKQIITHDYEPIIGGTFSLTSATVDEATKTVAIQSGGTMSVVDVRGGKDSVIDLGGTHIVYTWGTVNSALMSGVIISGGFADYGGALSVLNGRTVTLSGCTLTKNRAGTVGNVLVQSSGNLLMYDTIVSGNLTGNTMAGVLVANDGYCLASSCSFDNNLGDFMIQFGGSTLLKDCEVTSSIFTRSGGVLELAGSNHLYGSTYNNLTGRVGGSVTLTSGAVLDLTGNTNATPIAPGGGVVINEPAYVMYDHDSTGASVGSSATAQICGGTFSTIQNGGVFNVGFNQLGPGLVSSATIKHTNVAIAQSALVLSDCIIDLGSARFVNSSTVTFGGTVKSHNRFGDAYEHEYIIKDNTTLNFSGAYVGTADFLVAGSTITIGSGAACVLVNGTSVPLTSGTYTSAKINLDGTITEA